MSQTLPEGIESEPPFTFTYGSYVMQSGQWALIGRPVKASTEKESGTNKMVVVNYTDLSGIEQALGLPYKTKAASGTVDNDRMGLGHFRRDIRLYLEAIHDLYYVQGTNPLPAQAKIAPHPSGFQEWKPGMAEYGFSLEHAIYTGTYGKVHMKAIDTSKCLKTYTETATFTSQVASLTYAPFDIIFAYGSGSASGAKAYNVIPSGYAQNVGEVSVDFSGVTGEFALRVSATDGAGTMYTRYTYY